jgi:hypothetical protein
VATAATALRSAVERRAREAHTPLRAPSWASYLARFDLLAKHGHLLDKIRFGFRLGVRPITIEFQPRNPASALVHADVLAAEHRVERDAGRYLGPYPAAVIRAVLGPLHVSPQSVIAKSTPGKFRLIQNMSFPYSDPRIRSINSDLASSSHPCSWGTFWAVSLLIASLPEGSEGGIRDVEGAFRSIPIAPDEWAGLVVRAPEGDDLFDVDTAACFGACTCPGVYGEKHDGFLDILRASGIGPCTVWVDDNLFLRIKHAHLEQYNAWRGQVRRRIGENGGRRAKGARLWYEGGVMPDGRVEEWAEDFRFPIRDLSGAAPGDAAHNAQFTYSFADVDRIARDLGVVFAIDKNVEFATRVPFTGLEFDLATKDVGLPETKRTKYAACLKVFLAAPTLQLRHVQSLYGKLLHTCTVVPKGRAYLTGLESFIASYDNARPFLSKHLPRAARGDLDGWWRRVHAVSLPRRPLPVAAEVWDPHAYSDASSGFGIAIWIDGRWRAWRLKRGWDRDGRGIAWAEALGMEFLVRSLIDARAADCHLRVWGDNTTVVEGWWNSRSRDRFVNDVFRRLHPLLRSSSITAHTRYVESASNPADKPSRGIYPPRSALLPPLELGDLSEFLRDFDDERAELDCCLLPSSRTHAPVPVPTSAERAERLRRSAERDADDAIARVIVASWDGE